MPTEKNVVTTDRIDHPVNIYFQKKFLKTLEALRVYGQFGQNAELPQHAGDTYKWRRYAELSAATTPLEEVQDPNPVLPEKTDLSVLMRNYGSWMKTSAWRDMTGLTQDKNAMTERITSQARLTLDTLIRNVTAGGASSTTCSNGSGTSTLLNAQDIKTVVKNLLAENARMITPMISAGSGQGTSPIRASFVVIAHTDLQIDIEDVAGFKHVSTYASARDAYQGEWGSIGNTRWILTTNAYSSGGYYYCLFIAEDFFGKVRIQGSSRPLIYHSPSQTGSPLEMFGTLGWKIPYACKILYDVLGHSLLCTSNY